MVIDHWKGTGRLVVFGDSITVGMGASSEQRGWPVLVAASLRADLVNLGASGTVLQASVDASGRPRPGNGLARVADALTGDHIVLLYGYNDARYTAAPNSLNVAAFERDYRRCIEFLFSHFAPDRICLGSPPYIPTAGFSIGTEGFTGQTREGFELYVKCVRRLAGQFGVFYADVYEAMASHPDGTLAAPDVTHPNDAGHLVIAESILGARRM